MGQAVAELPAADERVVRRSLVRRLMSRPELGALIGAVAVFVFFSVVADAFLQASSFSTVLYASSTFGIMAVGVSLLMIGGEFDLSAGVMVTTSALVAALVGYQLTLNLWVGVAISLVVSLALGFLNGLLYVKTGLPSFIITLATFFMLAGANLGVTKAVTGNVASDSVRDMDGFSSARAAIGAFIFGMTNKGIVYAEWNPDWFKFFLGAMLLVATVVNLIVRRRVEQSR
jgi:simple sugar transport system permease protein